MLNGKRINSPIGESTRPTTAIVREAIINILKGKIHNSNWLDLYSGSGIIGCEAIEHGANSVLAIEANRKTFKTCASNLNKIASSSQGKAIVKSINTDVSKFLKYGLKKYLEKTLQKNVPFNYGFEYVYLDPPYKELNYTSILNELLLGNWVMKESLVIYEFSKEGKKINIPDNWSIKYQKAYGKTGLLFLTPNLA